MNNRSQHYLRDLRRYYRLPVTQVSLTVVISIVIVAVFVVLALRPTASAIVTLKKNISESEKTLEQLQKKTKSLQQAATALETIKPKLDLLNSALPNNSAGYDPLVSQLEQLAAVSNVTLQSETVGANLLYSRVIAPFTAKKSQTVMALPVSVRIVGSYGAVKSYLSQLMEMERVIAVDSVIITKEANSRADNIVVSLNLTGRAYYLADEQQLKNVLEGKRRK